MEAFAPCLGVNGAVFIAISTYTTEDNYLTILFKNEDEDSKKLFTKKIVELWCADCKTAGIPVETCNKLGHTADLMVGLPFYARNIFVLGFLEIDEKQ